LQEYARAVRPFERLRSRLRPARICVNTPEKSSVTMPAIGTSASGTNIWDGVTKPSPDLERPLVRVGR
jgi:hypothetical protein